MPRPLLLAALLSAACGGGQMGAGSSYPGDPLFQYSGKVRGTSPLPPIEVWFVWQRQAPPSLDDMFVVTGALDWPTDDPTVEAWWMGLFFPPQGPFQQLREGEALFARGNAVSVPADFPSERIAELPGSNNSAYGVDVTHWVLYFLTAVKSNSVTEWWLNGARPSANRFYYAAVNPAPCLDAAALDACVAEVQGLGSGVPTDEATRRCQEPRLTLVDPSEASAIDLGVSAVPTPTCP